MKIVINQQTEAQAGFSAQSVERLLRIAFTRYASLLKQVDLSWRTTTCPDLSPGYAVHLRACLHGLPDVHVDEVQTRLQLAMDRAIQRTDGMLRQSARRKQKTLAG